MSRCELCSKADKLTTNKAEYIMKMKNISNSGLVNANYSFKVCKECYDSHNPDNLKRTEISIDDIPLDDIDSISPRLAKYRTKDPLVHDFIVTDLKKVVSDGIIVHWRKIRKG